MRRLIVFLAAIAFVLVAAVLVVNPVDALLNRTTGKPHPVSPQAQALHDSLWIADFHNDALLWDRNILEPSSRGLVDLPRLERGGFELAVFSATTRMHIDSNYYRTLPVLDILPAVAIASHWPRRAWLDPYQRALVLGEKLHTAAVASQGRLHVITSRQDMADDSRIGGVLLLEGLHAIDGDVARVDSLFNAGYRIFGIAHMYDNEIGGSSAGWRKGGLTPLAVASSRVSTNWEVSSIWLTPRVQPSMTSLLSRHDPSSFLTQVSRRHVPAHETFPTTSRDVSPRVADLSASVFGNRRYAEGTRARSRVPFITQLMSRESNMWRWGQTSTAGSGCRSIRRIFQF